MTIAGAADAPIDPTSDLYRNLLQALQRYGDPSLPVRLDVRELLALTVSAKVGLLPDFAWESVEPAVRAALLDAFGFERRALAQSVYLSELVACMQAVRGVAWVDVDAFGSLDETTLLAGFGAAAATARMATVRRCTTPGDRRPPPRCRRACGCCLPATTTPARCARRSWPICRRTSPTRLLLQEATP